MSDQITIIEDRVIVSPDESSIQVVSVGVQGPAGVPGDPASNLVTSVAGKTGAVTLDKSDVGLSAVNNTSDATKPVSTAQAAAIEAANKVNRDTAIAMAVAL